jgi:hypothetical protein
MTFTKASKRAKLFRKLLHGHETQNGIPIQKVENAVAHEILREHLGNEHLWRSILVLGLASTTLLSLLCHYEGVVALRDKINPTVPRNKDESQSCYSFWSSWCARIRRQDLLVKQDHDHQQLVVIRRPNESSLWEYGGVVAVCVGRLQVLLQVRYL